MKTQLITNYGVYRECRKLLFDELQSLAACLALTFPSKNSHCGNVFFQKLGKQFLRTGYAIFRALLGA